MCTYRSPPHEHQQLQPPQEMQKQFFSDIDNNGDSMANFNSSFPSIFFITSTSGIIYFVSDNGDCNEILAIPEVSFLMLQYLEHDSTLIFITSDMILHQYQIALNDNKRPNENENEANRSVNIYDDENESENVMSEHNELMSLKFIKSVKLSIKSSNLKIRCIYLFDGLLAVSNEKQLIRVFDAIHSDSYVLSLNDARHMTAPNDTITQIYYSNQPYKTIIGVTAKNRIVFWKFRYKALHYQSLYNNDPSELDWEILPPINLNTCDIEMITHGMSSLYNKRELCLAVFAKNKIKDVAESSNKRTTTVSNDTTQNLNVLRLYNEMKSHFKQYDQFSFVQFAPNRLLIHTPDDSTRKIGTKFSILNMHCNSNVVVVSDTKQLELYYIDVDSSDDSGDNAKTDGNNNVSSSTKRVTQPIKIRSFSNLQNMQCILHVFSSTTKVYVETNTQKSISQLNSQDDKHTNHGKQTLFQRQDFNAGSKWNSVGSKVKTMKTTMGTLSMNTNSAQYQAASTVRGSIITINRSVIELYNFDGEFKYALQFQEVEEGYPISMDIKGDILAVVTSERILKIWELGKYDENKKHVANRNNASDYVKLILPGKDLSQWIDSVSSIKLNANATKISLLTFLDTDNSGANQIFVYDTERDDIHSFKMDSNTTV